MRKIFTFLAISSMFIFLFGINVKAQSQGAIDKFKEEFQEKYNFTISDENAEIMLDEWQNGRYLYSAATSTNYKMVFSVRSDSLSGGTLGMYGGDILYDGSISVWGSNAPPTKTTLTGYQASSYMCFAWGLYEDFAQQLIDFENVYYSPQIPIPTIDIYMGSDVNNPTSGQAVWNASLEVGDNSQYYIQYGYKASFPSYIDVGLASLRGDFSYNYYNYTSTNYIDIVSLESLTTAVNQSKPASYFQSAWQSFYDDYLTQSLMPEFGTQVNAMSSVMLDDAKDYYVDYMLGQIPMYGNRLEVFARYFIIDSENNNRVVVGAWNHWSSKDGSRTKERPSNYIDNVALPGYINSSNDVEYQDNSNSFDSLGTSTGVPATIINNNYVPNYPDYPTIASYNKDNLLVSSIDKLNEVKGFFGEFNDFLTVTFVWVPDWIWALIGIGFSLSIIVFFLRML